MINTNPYPCFGDPRYNAWFERRAAFAMAALPALIADRHDDETTEDIVDRAYLIAHTMLGWDETDDAGNTRE